MTRLGAVTPGFGLRSDEFGRAMPVGNTVRNVGLVWSVAVMFNTTDPTPVAGTPARPSTGTVIVAPAPSAPAPAATPSIVGCATRLSSTRAGSKGLYDAPSGEGNQPWMSAIRLTAPA